MHAPENAEAIEGCLSAACRGVRVEIGEIWKRESKQGSKYSPVHVFASETTLETFSRVLVGSEIDRTRKHKLSPQVCFDCYGMSPHLYRMFHLMSCIPACHPLMLLAMHLARLSA